MEDRLRRLSTEGICWGQNGNQEGTISARGLGFRKRQETEAESGLDRTSGGKRIGEERWT